MRKRKHEEQKRVERPKIAHVPTTHLTVFFSGDAISREEKDA
jgi:hypothetical protein